MDLGSSTALLYLVFRKSYPGYIFMCLYDFYFLLLFIVTKQ